MAHVLQVGVGSGGMPVLDMLCRDPNISRVTLIEPDVYKLHNLERHLFPESAVGQPKAKVAAAWLHERRPNLEVHLLPFDLLDVNSQAEIERAAGTADIGVCAADNESAKYHWDELMRRHHCPWTLGEVLSGGIGGFVHWFIPGGPCYGCVASFLQRSITLDQGKAADYSQPQGQDTETTIPAPMASIHAIASLHALVTLELLKNLESYDPGFTSLLWSLRVVPHVFEEAFRPYRFRVPRSADCLICRPDGPLGGNSSAEDLNVALDQALARLGNA